MTTKVTKAASTDGGEVSEELTPIEQLLLAGFLSS